MDEDNFIEYLTSDYLEYFMKIINEGIGAHILYEPISRRDALNFLLDNSKVDAYSLDVQL